MQLQLSLFELHTVGWQIPLREFCEKPESREIPHWFVAFASDLSEEKLKPLSGRQLVQLCMYWGCPVSGTKKRKASNILRYYNTYLEALQGHGHLKSKKATELRRMMKDIGKSHSYLNKQGVIEQLIAWAETVHESFRYALAKTRHYLEVSNALSYGEEVPDKVIISNPVYVDLERRAKGLPLAPAKMTTDEWLAYQNRRAGQPADYRGPLRNVAKGKAHSSAWLEAERHWNTVEKAIADGRKLTKEVLEDHVKQTERRNKEIETAVISRPEIMQGDKVRYGDKVGRVQYSRPVIEGYGMEYVIHTGRIMITFPDVWEYFTAPMGDVELLEPNPWIRAEMGKVKSFKIGDYVAWDDLDGRHWLGHVLQTGRDEEWVNVRLYSPLSGPLQGPQAFLIPRHSPTLRATEEKTPITDIAKVKHREYWEKYSRKPNRADLWFLQRLHDLFGTEMPAGKNT